MGASQLSKFPFDEMVVRKLLKSGESSTTISAGNLVRIEFDSDDGTIVQAGADDPAGPIGVAEEEILAGASGWILFRGYTTVIDLNGLTDGDILAPAATGGVAAVNADQERRVIQVVDASADIAYVNGLCI